MEADNSRLASIDRDLARWRAQREKTETRLALIDDQICQLEELRDAELAATPPAEPEPDEPAPSEG